MSLTVLVHEKRQKVAIVEWFREFRRNIDIACGPVNDIPFDTFRETGHQMILRHFKDYSQRRIPLAEVGRVFEPRQAKKFMDGRRALEIDEYPSGKLMFCPMSIEKYSLSHLRRIKADATIPISSPPDIFWRTFDEVLARAEPDEPVL